MRGLVEREFQEYPTGESDRTAGSEKVGGTGTEVVGEVPQSLAPSRSGGVSELRELGLSHGSGLPAGVSPFDEIPGLENGMNEGRFE